MSSEVAYRKRGMNNVLRTDGKTEDMAIPFFCECDAGVQRVHVEGVSQARRR